MASTLRVAIIGGGIGGLALALALRERGLTADVYEQTPQLTEIGAAVALTANATRELERIGLGDRLAAAATTPVELIHRHWRDGSRIAAHPIRNGSWYRNRFHAPVHGIRRAQLQVILSSELAAGTLHLGRRLVGITEGPGRVVLGFSDGDTADADVVVGADGIRSTVRRWVTGGNHEIYSGTSGFRGIVPVDRLPGLPDPQAIQFWTGPGAHLLHYPVGPTGDSVNFLAVVDGPQAWARTDGWVDEIAADEPLRAFAGWHPAATAMIGAVTHAVRWGLFAVRPFPHWHRGRAVLLGDAAHAMLPHQGQGANTTVEDAFTLAALLAQVPDTIELPSAFASYQALRRGRTRRIQRLSWRTNALLHLSDGAAADERNRALARLPQDIAWIHEHDVQVALRRRTEGPARSQPAPTA
ncbi:MAG TPA: FAD-dependent monooxygenase [Pseudonocardia sp.]